MPRIAAIADTRSLSDLLSGLELRGQSWCYSDLGRQAGFSVPPGDAVLFHAVLHGSIRIACASGDVAVLEKGDVAIVVSGEAHALRTSPESEASTHEFLREERAVDIPPTVMLGTVGTVCARVLSGRLRPSWPSEVSRSTLPPMLQLAKAEGGPAAALLQQDALALSGMGAGSAALMTRLASLMLVAGLRAEPGCRRLFAPQRRDPIAQALQLIEGNPSASWTVEKLARSVGMGRSNFAAHFTQSVGRAPMEVVAEHRMEHAAALLRQGRLKIAEISEMAGYSSEAAFSRRFTRHFGLSPSQMRDSVRACENTAEARPLGFYPLLTGRPAEDAAAIGRQRAAGGVSAPGASADRPLDFSHSGYIRLGSRD